MNESDNLEDVIVEPVQDTHGLFSGNQPEASYQGAYPAGPVYPAGNVYPNYSGQSQEPQSYYGNQQNQSYYGAQQNPPYYGNQQTGGYGAQPPYGNQENPSYYENQQAGGYGAQTPYGDQQNPSYYGNPQTSGYGGQQIPYGNLQNQSYYGNQAGGYGGGYGGQPPYGNQPPYDNPYNPYAQPQKKQHAGLIVGIVVVIIILFLVAVFALASRAVNLLSDKEKERLRRDVYDFDDYDDDYDYNFHHDYDHDEYFHFDDDYGYDYDYDYDDYFDDDDYDYDYDSEQYYTIHSDIKYDLSYQVEMEYYEYERDNDNVLIMASYPVISGEAVSNLDKINEAVRKELDDVVALFEKEYEPHMDANDDDDYFVANLDGYVTYMDEDKLSIAYEESYYSHNMGGGVFLISVNVDMKNGVVLDNKEMLMIDDDFSVDFRRRSDEQNGEIYSLNYMTDQEITDYFNSDNVIVFYTPKGMEIGINYEDGNGWVTVTYEEYEEYLKVF